MRAIFLTTLLSLLVSGLVAEEFAVIVNADATELSFYQERIKQLYLKKRTISHGKARAMPLDRPPGSLEHRVFLEKVLGMSKVELAQYWLAMKQKTGKTAPKAIANDRVLLRLVSKYSGAFGVVRREVAESAVGVKILFTFVLNPSS